MDFSNKGLLQRTDSKGITVVAIFAILAGLAEVYVGFTGNFLGILSTPLMPATETIIIGACYVLGGLFLTTKRKWGAMLGMLFILFEILARINAVRAGVVPTGGVDFIKVVIGAAIAVFVVLYIASQWKTYN